MRLVFATNNRHKLEEARSILSGISVLSLNDIGFHADIPEDGATLEENSSFKCRFVSSFILNSPESSAYIDGCFSDDTGLEIAALGGLPGVHTARWASVTVDSAANRRKALQELQEHSDRSAQFRTVVTLTLFDHQSDNQNVVTGGRESGLLQFEGAVRGQIAEQEYGEHGFGYDPVFIPEGYEKTFAQLPAEVKNAISHRARALTKMCDFFKKNHLNFVM